MPVWWRFWGLSCLESFIVKIAGFFVHDGALVLDREDKRVFKDFFRSKPLASLMLLYWLRGEVTMKFNRNLMTGLFGLALLAAPISAAAKDNDHGGNDAHQAQAQSHESHQEAHHAEAPHEQQHEARVETRSAPAAMERHEARQDNRQDNRNAFREQRNERVETRNVAPETRQEFRGQRESGTWMPAPAVVQRRDAREDRHDANRDWRQDRREANPDWRQDRNQARRDSREDRHDGHWIYGDRGRDYDLSYDPDYDREYASGWVMPYSYSGGACAWARHLRNVYRHDVYTGHPAAAESLLYQMHRAERRCGAARYGYNSYRYPY